MKCNNKLKIIGTTIATLISMALFAVLFALFTEITIGIIFLGICLVFATFAYGTIQDSCNDYVTISICISITILAFIASIAILSEELIKII